MDSATVMRGSSTGPIVSLLDTAHGLKFKQHAHWLQHGEQGASEVDASAQSSEHSSLRSKCPRTVLGPTRPPTKAKTARMISSCFTIYNTITGSRAIVNAAARKWQTSCQANFPSLGVF